MILQDNIFRKFIILSKNLNGNSTWQYSTAVWNYKISHGPQRSLNNESNSLKSWIKGTVSRLLNCNMHNENIRFMQLEIECQNFVFLSYCSMKVMLNVLSFLAGIDTICATILLYQQQYSSAVSQRWEIPMFAHWVIYGLASFFVHFGFLCLCSMEIAH